MTANRKARPGRYPQASTTARGYGWSHQQIQARLIAAWRPGDPCARCGLPMWERWTTSKTGKRISAIHLGHTDNRAGYTGLEHMTCNVRDGAQRGARARARGRRPQPQSQPEQLQLFYGTRW
jgi:hypothetical protein